MDDLQFNVINPESIGAYLKQFSNNDPYVANLLVIALEKPLKKRAENISRIGNMPENAPNWLIEKWETCGPWHIFDPKKDIRLAYQVGHITDWIVASIKKKAEWLECIDSQNRPLKLLKIGTLEQAIYEADKAMKLATQSMSKEETPGSTSEILSFDNGYKFVELLTPQSLDRESAYLRHCIGDGAYDEAVTGEEWSYISLRDERNIPHATLEINSVYGILMQCKGKQNTPPVAKYFPYIKTLVEHFKLDIEEDPSQTGLLRQGETYYDVFNLPSQFEYEGNLSFGETNRPLSLPKNLSVKGSLNLYYFKREITLPDNMVIEGDLELPEHNTSKTLPEGLTVKGDLSLSRWSQIEQLPDSLSVESNVRVVHCPELKSIPDSLSEITGGLSLCGCKSLQSLPSKLVIMKKYEDAPVFSGELNLTGCISLKELPETLYVDGPLYLNGCKSLQKLPKNLVVKGNIFTDFGIFSGKEEFIQAFELEKT